MKTITNFSEAHQYLAKFYTNIPADYRLDNMRRLMELLDNPQEKFKTVHIAGTSGKTSTAYYTAALLTASSHKTGLTVSPHVDEINELVQIDGDPLPEKEFCEALTTYLQIVEAGPVKPSWYEVMVAFAYWCFARQQVEYAVVEVGLGGLKDGTNVITRPDKICVITDIGLDHVTVLGNSLGEIAEQKIGIVQERNTVFTYRQASEIMIAFEKKCNQRHATLNVIEQNQQDDLNDVPTYQQRNWWLAKTVYEYLTQRDNLIKLDETKLAQTQRITIPGRMDVKQIKGKTIVMDGAHNVQKMAVFEESFSKLYPDVKPAVLISVKQDKDYKQIVPILAPIVAEAIVTSYQVKQDTLVNSLYPQLLADEFIKAGVKTRVIADPHDAFQALLKVPEKVCVITGSFYLLNQIRNNEQLV